MIKKLSLPIIGILLVGGTVFGAYELISSIPLSSTSIHENVLSGTEVADLSTIGGEGPYDYSLTVSGSGIDNDKFYVSGSKLYLNFDPDYENPSDSGLDNKYTIELKTLDSSKPTQYAKDWGRWFTVPGGFYADGSVGSTYFIQGLMKDGSVYYAGPDFSNYIWAPEDSGFVNLVTNWNATAGLKIDGSIVTRGKIGSGGTGGPTGNGYVSIYSSPIAFAALHGDGSIYSWGVPERGGSGAPTATGYTEIISNNSGFTALKDDGSVFSRGSVDITNIPTDTGFVSIFANGGGSFVAIKADGSLKSWGKSGLGGSGAPTGTGFISAAGNAYAFAALKSNGSIVAWGDASRGGTSPAGTGYVKIYGGGQIFVALKNDGSINSWGNATYAAGAPTGTGFVDIYAGNWTAAARKDNGLIYSRGTAAYGGTGEPTRAGFVDVVGNYYAMVALHEDGSVVARGDATKGGSGAPTGTGFIKVFALGSSLAAVHEDGSVIYWGSTINDNPTRIGVSYKQLYNIEILDQDEISPIGNIIYSQGNNLVTARLQLNESGSVTNNGGSFEYTFTQTGSFVFEFVDLAGNTGNAIATVTVIPSNGGPVRMTQDSCPDGDNSPSYYDHLCEILNMSSGSADLSGATKLPTIIDGVPETKFQPKWEEIYQWAKTNGLTTMPDYTSARLGDPITRAELAKVMVNYLKDHEIDDSKVCIFDDIVKQSEELKGYIKQACQMGIIGVNINNFNPDVYVTRAELATILSRAFWGNTYENTDGLYYERHINVLKQKSILTNTDPFLLEARGYVFLMLMRR